ncbi:hypothetical protein Dimus_023835, partial [Dionaea muscipula]
YHDVGQLVSYGLPHDEGVGPSGPLRHLRESFFNTDGISLEVVLAPVSCALTSNIDRRDAAGQCKNRFIQYSDVSLRDEGGENGRYAISSNCEKIGHMQENGGQQYDGADKATQDGVEINPVDDCGAVGKRKRGRPRKKKVIVKAVAQMSDKLLSSWGRFSFALVLVVCASRDSLKEVHGEASMGEGDIVGLDGWVGLVWGLSASSCLGPLLAGYLEEFGGVVSGLVGLCMCSYGSLERSLYLETPGDR